MPRESSVSIVKEFCRLWPREVFYMKKGNKYHVSLKEQLNKSGVYILYREDKPHYIGKGMGQKGVFARIKSHATKPDNKRFNFWTHFSAYIVDKKYVDAVESILINAIPLAANDVKPRHEKIKIPKDIKAAILDLKKIPVNDKSL